GCAIVQPRLEWRKDGHARCAQSVCGRRKQNRSCWVDQSKTDFLLQCMNPLLAQSGVLLRRAKSIAFGAKAYITRRLRKWTDRGPLSCTVRAPCRSMIPPLWPSHSIVIVLSYGEFSRRFKFLSSTATTSHVLC